MQTLKVAIAGFGGVGRATAELLLQRRDRYRQVYGVDVRLVAVCGSRAGLADAFLALLALFPFFIVATALATLLGQTQSGSLTVATRDSGRSSPNRPVTTG